MPAELGDAIAAVMIGAGEGLAGLRRLGAELEVVECAIEIDWEGADEPRAHVRLSLGEAAP